MAVNYEWDAETIDRDSGDILDHNHWDKLSDLSHKKNDPEIDIVLVRDDWRDDGELMDRTHWYPERDEKPEFSNGLPVPKRFIKEFEKVWK